VSTVVGVDVHADGSGVVRAGVGLDADASREFTARGGSFAVDDLRRAGWQVVGPRREHDNRTWVRVSKSFGDPAQARAIVAELSGANGPFHDFRVTRRHAWFHTRTRFAGRVDLSGGMSGFVDRGYPVTPSELTQLAGPLNRLFPVQVVVRLPGSVDANAPVVTDNGAVWQPHFGEAAVALEATATSWDVRALVLLGVALVAGVAAIVFVVLGVAHRRRTTSA
jgi:hypothetical protein